MPKFNWKQKKTIAMYINRRQWERDSDPIFTSAIEILLENGSYLVRESSITATPTYIITE